MEPQNPTQTIQTDPKAIVAGLTDNSLLLDSQTSAQLLMQIQSGYESNVITEKDYLFAESKLLQKISPTAQGLQTALPAPYGSNERVKELYRQKSELLGILDSLADAVASEKITDSAYEKLHMTNNDKVNSIQSRIDEESGLPKVVATPIERGSLPRMYSSSSYKAAELPDRAKEIKQELSAISPAPLQEPQETEKQLPSAGEISKFSSPPDEQTSKFSGPKTEYAIQGETGYAVGDATKIDATGKPDTSIMDMAAKIDLYSNDFEGRILELSTRLSNSEEQMTTRLSQIRELVSKVEKFQQSMDMAAESARQVQENQRQMDRAERVAELMGKTFVSLQKKFNEMEQLSMTQKEESAKMTELYQRLALLEPKTGQESKAPAALPQAGQDAQTGPDQKGATTAN